MMVGRDTPASMADWRRKLEQARKEVREIRNLESQIKWNMQRQEKKEVDEEKKAVDDDIRDWRYQQHEEMKEFVSQKEKEQKLTELAESKDYQEYKRLRKQMEREEEQRYIQECYLQDREQAEWNAELQKQIIEEQKGLLEEKAEDVMEIKELKVAEKIRNKEQEVQDRLLEQTIEMDYASRQLQSEREALLQSLEYARSRQNAAVLGGRGSRPGR